MFAEEVHSLAFPSPWLKQYPTLYRAQRDGRDGRTLRRAVRRRTRSRFARELAHFHDCIVDGTPCRTPPEQARLDIDVLTQMFLRPAARVTALRSAIVGSGFIARVHAAAVRDLGVTVVAVCSRTQSGAERLAGELATATAFESLEDLLGSGGVDVAARLHAE